MSVILCLLSCSLSIYCCEPFEEITEIIESELQPQSAVIFLHGTGESGPLMREIVESHIGSLSQYPSIRFIFPTAKAIPFRPFPWNGQITTSWIDGNVASIDCEVNYEVLDTSAALIDKWVQDQVLSGIPSDRICVVGYSNGATMSLVYGYEYAKKLGCVGGIAGFIPRTTNIRLNATRGQNEIKTELPPLYLTGAAFDFIVFPSWVEETVQFYKSIGVRVIYNHQPLKSHFINTEALEGLLKFIVQTIDNLPCNK
ncbi:lysophospholipase-like protein 1 isoform X1 [Halyomorpha halys]|uniref:lysophospholipase-like protein 1 isoform X1 n=1 Tax=Halyomorpha halys TaxID=286706 RepID=UPI0006D5256F|nr:lysophospholipase-like protein 1 isoform X1 [Halyomorpha halys]